MRIITISREFGSGGRELGKRLGDVLGFDYYDKEIITAIATNKGMDEGYVTRALVNQGWRNVPLTYRNSFLGGAMQSAQTELLLAQKYVIDQIGKAGKDCVIVGRNADVLLHEYGPFNIFVCADMASRIHRCVERGPEEEDMTVKELKRKIQRVDKNRAQTRSIITGSPWGQRSAYHLTVNTSDWVIKELTPAVASFSESWFGRTKQ